MVLIHEIWLKKIFEITLEQERFIEGNIEFMNAAMDVKLLSSFAKHSSIADPSLGYGLLAQIKRHNDFCYEEPQMNQEKLRSCNIEDKCRKKC